MIETVIDKLEIALEENRQLRDDNHVCPDAVLLYTENANTLEEVALMELPLRFPLKGKGCRWSYEDLGKVLEAKALLYRQSVVAHEISDENPEAQPPCGTVVIVQHAERHCLSWFQVTARIDPELND
jgi:hypothetical protein